MNGFGLNSIEIDKNTFLRHTKYIKEEIFKTTNNKSTRSTHQRILHTRKFWKIIIDVGSHNYSSPKDMVNTVQYNWYITVLCCEHEATKMQSIGNICPRVAVKVWSLFDKMKPGYNNEVRITFIFTATISMKKFEWAPKKTLPLG